MLIPEHGYIVEHIDAPENTPNGKHKFQRLILNKPGYTDEFGEKKGKDDLFEARAWNQKINDIPVLQKGDKVKAMLNIRGNETINERGQKLYFTDISIRKIEKL